MCDSPHGAAGSDSCFLVPALKVSLRFLELVFFTFNAELNICDVENSKFSPPAVYTLPDSAKATRVT
ncbi:uncharacterized [Tachysurus ichikawai]